MKKKVNQMIKSIKARLNPNNKQLTKLFQYAGCARFAYNWAIAREQENYKQGNKFLSDCELRKEFTQLKKQSEYQWLNEVSNNVTKQAIKDACNNKKGASYCKTSNIIKREKELLKITKRLTNIRQNYLHQTTSEIVKRKPSFICIEDLNVSGMMKNKHLSKAVQQQGFYEFRRQIEYKSAWNNIPVIIADRFFPSSKLCSCCGQIKKDLKLSDRIYKCKCGNIIDRDYQAALNLKRYGENVLKQSVG